MSLDNASKSDAIQTLALAMTNAKSQQRVTLQTIARATGVDAGQISRLMHGQFVRSSGNLAKVCTFLQIDLRPYFASRALPEDVVGRTEALWHKSPQHRDALLDVLTALERL